jgi:hypothetical protein
MTWAGGADSGIAIAMGAAKAVVSRNAPSTATADVDS